MKRGSKVVLLLVLKELKKGLTPSQISRKYDLKKQTLQHKLTLLKKEGCIKKVGYGVWEVTEKKYNKCPKAGVKKYNNSKQIRGHAFIWKVRFSHEEIEWERRVKQFNVPYSMICNNSVVRIMLKGRKVWLSRKGVTIYEPLDFMGDSSYESKGKAVFELDTLIKDLGRLLSINLLPYKFTTSREHYGLIKNHLAKQYNSSGEKLYIRNDEGTVWLWIDNSHSLHELETNGVENNRGVQGWYNDMERTKFKVTPTFVLNAINQNAQNLDQYATHLKAHVQSVQELGSSVKELTKVVKDLKGNI